LSTENKFEALLELALLLPVAALELDAEEEDDDENMENSPEKENCDDEDDAEED
jgi:hypothetical protein